MFLETKLLFTGVGALIISSGIHTDSFVTVIEQRSKRSTNKLKGMLSLPMETTEIGEDHHQTLERLFQEEVRVNLDHRRNRVNLCACELMPQVVMYAYLFEIDSENVISWGSHTDEVSNVMWTEFEEVLNEPKGSLRFRPGVHECVVSCLEYLKDPENFHPPVISFRQLRHQIPSTAFDLIEGGVSEKEVLSRLGLAPQLLPNLQLLSHL